MKKSQLCWNGIISCVIVRFNFEKIYSFIHYRHVLNHYDETEIDNAGFDKIEFELIGRLKAMQAAEINHLKQFNVIKWKF